MMSSLYGYVFILFAVSTMADINEFFPNINGNLTKISWAHAVNDQSLLNISLNSSVMMLEADVSFGHVIGDNKQVPIMAHPPATESDLSLEQFLTQVNVFNINLKNKDNRKGIKLDFKTMDAFNNSIPYISALYESIEYPIWINADIIQGPESANKPVINAEDFIKLAKPFTKSVLSLGWTTNYNSSTKLASYTTAQIQTMLNVITNSKITQEVTFPVRAVFAAQSWEQMQLLRGSKFTLTIWSSEGDDVDAKKLSKVIVDYGVNKTYVDVPEDLHNKLILG